MYKNWSLFILLITFSINSFAQWNYTMNLSSVGADSIKDVDFVTENNGLYCYDVYKSPSSGYTISVLSTLDGGFSWDDSWSDDGWENSYEIRTVRKQSTFYYAYNFEGSYHILESINNGNTWKQIAGGLWWYAELSAVDTSHVFFIDMANGNYYYLNKYVDNVLTRKIDSFPNYKPASMFFTDSLTGYIAASTALNTKNHLILKSTAAGIGWTQVFSDSLANINDLYFTNDSIGFLAGDSGTIIKTADGGQNWQYLNTNTTQNLYSIFFINDTIGYASGDSGIIINTTDGGLNWSFQTTGITTRFKKIFFVNDSVGFAVTGNKIYKLNSTIFFNINESSKNRNNGICVYPNPNNGIFSLKTNYLSSKIEILSTAGITLISLLKNSTDININISDFIPGLYILREKKGEEIVGTTKIIILPQ
jgi:photosystem II stability/assembly factor-like uncharacterized protein